MFEYIYKVLMLYGVIFLTLYPMILITGRLKNERLRNLVVLVFCGFLVWGVPEMRQSLGWSVMPEGKYMILAFVAFYYGLKPSLGLVAWMSVLSLYAYGNLAYGTILISILLVGWLLLIKNHFKMNGIKVNMKHLILISLTVNILPILLSALLFPRESSVSDAIAYTPLLMSASALLTFALFFAVSRELNKKELITQLENDKMEIQALYEEMYAAEETLRENYDELSKYKDQVEYYAFHNSKTGFYNKDYLVQFIEKDLNRLESANQMLLYISIRDLESFLKSLGHTMIEVLHYIMGTTIHQCLPPADRIDVFDISNCRFALWAMDTDKAALENFVQVLQAKLKDLQLVEKLVIQVPIAVGGVTVTHDPVEPALWLEYAEIAMLEAAEGPSSAITWFNEALYAHKQYESRLERDLRDAIRQNEMTVVFQPQFNTQKQLIGSEALVRWRHSEFGAISPAVFIPLAERLGLVDGIGQFVLKTCVAFQKVHLQKTAYTVPISLNISLIELMNPDFAESVCSLLRENDLTYDVICLEITETAMVNQLEMVKASIDYLAKEKIALHLDDFGTGYSSLAYLTQFPITMLKIDKSFIDRFLNNEKDWQVVQLIISLGHNLSLFVLAEGVETEAQFNELVKMGCDGFQGYYLAKPLSKTAYEQLIDSKDPQ